MQYKKKVVKVLHYPNNPRVIQFHLLTSIPKSHFITASLVFIFLVESIDFWISFLIFDFIVALSANGFANPVDLDESNDDLLLGAITYPINGDLS